MKSNNTIKRRSDCPISFGLDIFGDKWTLLILRDIIFYGRRRFSDFAPQEHIATNILTERLMRLESVGLISKRRDSQLRNQYIYKATEKADALLPTLIEMTLWGLSFDPESLASKAFIERSQRQKDQVVQEITQAIKSSGFTEYRQREMGIQALSA